MESLARETVNDPMSLPPSLGWSFKLKNWTCNQKASQAVHTMSNFEYLSI